MADTTMKKFVTSAKNASDKAKETELVGKPLMIEVDGRKLTFYPPDSAQFVLMIASLEAAVTKLDRFAALVNVFFGMLRDEDKSYMFERLRDQEDDFDLEELSDIIEYVTEEWSATPTDGPSDSSSERPQGGKSSKAKRHHAAHRSGATT